MSKYSLPEKFINQIAGQGETGMGFQVVSVTTKDNRKFKNVIVSGCTEIIGIYEQPSFPFQVDEIAEIKVTHRKDYPANFDQKKWFMIEGR